MPERTGLAVRQVGQYEICRLLARGGMGTIHLGRHLGPLGFVRVVAMKCLHPHLLGNPDTVAMFKDEARLAGRIRHPNVVTTLDVVAHDDELFLVLEYVHGEILSVLSAALAERRAKIPLDVASAILSGALLGLDAAHEATDSDGRPLDIVHRDVSPQNIIVGVDGTPRVLDFGVAAAKGRIHTTEDGSVKGKIAYMAPEQLRDEAVDRRTDVYAAGVVLWEVLAGRSLFAGSSHGAVLDRVHLGARFPPSKFNRAVPEELDALTMKALSRDPSARFESAKQMAIALEQCVHPAAPSKLGAWVTDVARERLAERALLVAETERGARGGSSGVVQAPAAAVGPGGGHPVAPSRRALSRALAAGGVLVVTATALWWWQGRPSAPPPMTAAAAMTAVSARSDPAHASGWARAGDASGADPPSASASASAPPARPPAVRAKSRPGAPRGKPTTHASSSRSNPCNPPYVLDAQGFKIYKRECL